MNSSSDSLALAADVELGASAESPSPEAESLEGMMTELKSPGTMESLGTCQDGSVEVKARH